MFVILQIIDSLIHFFKSIIVLPQYFGQKWNAQTTYESLAKYLK